MDMSLSKLKEIVKDREDWHVAVHGVTESDMTYQLNNNNIPCSMVKEVTVIIIFILIFWLKFFQVKKKNNVYILNWWQFGRRSCSCLRAHIKLQCCST